MNFTPSQQEAILLRGRSVLVSAGAGSGKTRVLTERLMEYLDPQSGGAQPRELSEFVVITFTRAAAGELRGRIAAAITARLQQHPENARLRRQLALCRSASICTIHTFCANLLRENAARAGISPGFRILEEERAERLRAEALERVLERRYAAEEEDFLRLADTVGAGRDDSRLAEQILKLHAAIQSHADPLAWTRSQLALLRGEEQDFAHTPWGAELLREGAETTRFWAAEMERCLAAMQGEESIRKACGDSFSRTAQALRRLEEAFGEGWDAARGALPVPFPRLNPVRNNPDPRLHEQLKARRDLCKKAMEKLEKTFAEGSAAQLAGLRASAPAMAVLLELAEELEGEFQGGKRRLNGLDFNDLEHRALSLLRTPEGQPTALANSVAGRYAEIMVDEYQDVSRVQDALFEVLSRGGRNLFFVGDVKQAIYRFRLADPSIFTEKAARYAAASSGRLIRLQENFRSRPEVLACVNAVFRSCMSAALGDLDYGPEDALIPGAAFPGAGERPELMLIPREDGELGAAEAEAEAVAANIERMLAGGAAVTEDGTPRPLRCGDIAILLRAPGAVGGSFRRALMKRGIPTAAGSAEDFYGSEEVAAVFAMLTVMDNPHQDLPLLTVLRSPGIGFSADRLSMIRATLPEGDFYSALCLSDDAQAAAFLQRLNRLRGEAPDRNPADLMERVIEEMDLYALCSAMPDAERRLRRLSALLQMAETFRRGDETGLHRFVLWLRNRERKGIDPGAGGEGADAVQILSIHKSKGLEFPVVFLSGLGRAFNRQDLRDTVLLHPKLGLGPKATDPVRMLEYPTAARRAVESRIGRETLSEEMRLLYVAMTRARERLILTACVRKPEAQLRAAASLALPLSLPDDVPASFPGTDDAPASSPGAHASADGKVPAAFLRPASCPLQWVLAAQAREGCFRLTGPEGEAQERTEEAAESVGITADEPEAGSEHPGETGARPDAAGDRSGETGAPAADAGPEAEMPSEAKDDRNAETRSEQDAALDALLERNLSWRYPWASAEELPSKVTPTELKGLRERDGDAVSTSPAAAGEPVIRLPALGEQQLSATRRGSAAHQVLQYIDFSRTGSEDAVREEILRLQRGEFLTEEEAKSVSPGMIRRFFASDLGRRLLGAERCRREFRFSLMTEARSVYPEAPEDERILLQGAVDCCFEEDGALVVLDYKTDRVDSEEALRERTERYRLQLETYAKALERIFGLPVKEKILYFLRAERQVRLDG